jgi:hydroxymethylpyrimidine pyrophosphatase-like HAD family hydrolase
MMNSTGKEISIIAIDFDGTIVRHDYPGIGQAAPHAIYVMKRLQELGYRLILHTMRSGKGLSEAIYYCLMNGVEFWAVNENPDQSRWTKSRKIYAHLYIDDMAFGTPMKNGMVDWTKVAEFFGIELPKVDREETA